MDFNLESIVFYILLLDALGANIHAYSSSQAWWHQHLNVMAKFLPLTRGWTTYYLTLVLIMGWLLHRNELLVWPF